MKSSARITVGSLVGERLAALGAASIPTSARQLIEDDIWASVSALVRRRVTAPMVGRAVARALAAPVATPEGSKGDVSPLASSGLAQSAQGRVAGPDTDTADSQPAASSGGPDQLPEGERL